MESSSQLVFLPGCQFDPTDDEIVFTYLIGKVDGDTKKLGFNYIVDNINLYEKEPSELAGLAPCTGHKKKYFFTRLEKKFRNGNVIKRQTKSGCWKKTRKESTDVIGEDGPILKNGNPIAKIRKNSLAFYENGGSKSPWLMKEYMLLDKNSNMLSPWTLCVVYDK